MENHDLFDKALREFNEAPKTPLFTFFDNGDIMLSGLIQTQIKEIDITRGFKGRPLLALVIGDTIDYPTYHCKSLDVLSWKNYNLEKGQMVNVVLEKKWHKAPRKKSVLKFWINEIDAPKIDFPPEPKREGDDLWKHGNDFSEARGF